jgi:hypothetical protein
VGTVSVNTLRELPKQFNYTFSGLILRTLAWAQRVNSFFFHANTPIGLSRIQRCDLTDRFSFAAVTA